MNITYEDKEALIISQLPDKNKVTADDMNEIKQVVNANAERGNFIYSSGTTEITTSSSAVSKKCCDLSLDPGTWRIDFSGKGSSSLTNEVVNISIALGTNTTKIAGYGVAISVMNNGGGCCGTEIVEVSETDTITLNAQVKSTYQVTGYLIATKI